jgi:hypothetical protein
VEVRLVCQRKMRRALQVCAVAAASALVATAPVSPFHSHAVIGFFSLATTYVILRQLRHLRSRYTSV